MRFGLNTFLYASPFTTDSVKLFPKLKGWGFDTVEIPIEANEHLDDVKVKAAADKAGLAIGSVCAAMGPGRDFRGSTADQKTATDYVKGLIDHAVGLDCKTVAGPMYSVVGLIGPHDDAEKKQQFDLVVKNLKPLAKYAESKGITLCIEPLNRFETDFLNTVEQGLKLVKAIGSKSVKLHLDTFHMNIEEKDQAAAIRRAGPLLGHLHACGCDRGTPGGDHILWKEIVKALKEIGYDGDVVIESFTTDVKVIARAAAIWRKMEPKRDDIAVKGLANLKQLFKRK
ncbi:MAG TPA: sugar phosphate isomerase/epimerase family protein [Chthoniobacteraceae bacterium]|jgi:D-psicose/D-tagatose/L-ribulose 3-epimerase